MTSLALFDFDGTITRKDSLIDMIQYAVGRSRYYMGLLKISPILVAYAARLISNDLAKEKLFTHFFTGWQVDDFQAVATRYADERLDNIVRPAALARIRWHKAQGHKVVVVSASMANWLKIWCDRYEADLIATRLLVEEGKLSGTFAGKNCYGLEKVNRINQQYNLADYATVYAYGNSDGDKEMLAVATKSYYKYFD